VNADMLSSGYYLVRMIMGDEYHIQKVVLLK